MITLRRYRASDRAWVWDAHICHYRETEGFSSEFDIALQDALNMLEHGQDDPRACYVIAQSESGPVGCIFLSAESTNSGRIRLFFVSLSHRRAGLGRRLLSHVMAHAQRADLKSVHVSTFDRHQAACSLYHDHGFRSAPNPISDVFGQRMRQIDFTIDLS